MPEHFNFQPCPFLPKQSVPLTASCLKPFGRLDRGPEFYAMALHYAQSLWLQGVPAQALLLVNRALGAAVSAEDEIVQRYPLPYRAAAWLLQHHGEGQFIGNPRRHYQHLATRMVEPRKELRTWRAWACWHMARILLPHMAADEVQLEAEGVIEPSEQVIFDHLHRLGHPTEPQDWLLLVNELRAAR